MADKLTTLESIIARDKNYVVNRQGKSFVLYAGLLNEAHERGIQRLLTEIVQFPSEANGQLAICKAFLEMKDGTTFTGIGDASPENVGRMIAMHTVRMSETRSKARALRDALNVGGACLEELGPEEEDYTPAPEPAKPAKPRTTKTTTPAAAVVVEEPIPITRAKAAPPTAQAAPAASTGERPITKLHRAIFSELQAINPELEGGMSLNAAEIEDHIGNAIALMAIEPRKDPTEIGPKTLANLKKAHDGFAARGVNIPLIDKSVEGSNGIRILQLLARSFESANAPVEETPAEPDDLPV